MRNSVINNAVLKIGIFCLFILLCGFTSDNFKKAQLKYTKVKSAYDEKWAGLENLLKEKKINPADFEIYLRAFKMDKKLEVWARDKESFPKFTLVKTYTICSTSGEPGPKRKHNDHQVPEGFYEIDLLNPNSANYLAMRINYPNYSDRLLGDKRNPGGAIMVQGSCSSTNGCIPISDEGIKEVYVLAVETKNKGGKIAIDVFPCYFTEKNMELLKKNYSPELVKFWEELRDGYFFFEKKKYTAIVTTDKDGHYAVKD